MSHPAITAGNTDPITLSNPGWFTFSTGLTPLAGSSIAATFSGGGGAAIIIGTYGRVIVNGFLSDTFETGA